MLNFMGIGAQKCGTSWLHSALATHPDIAFPAGKEVHYWNRPNGGSVEWYLQLFDDASRVNGDITPAYAFLPTDAIQKIHDALPELRLIYLIRNPLDRAWSAARMALGRAEMLHEDASDQWFIDHFNSKGSLARGDYETCIRNWRGNFPPDQLLIVRHESILTDPLGTANLCLRHVTHNSSYCVVDTDQVQQKVFEGDGVALRPKLREALITLYSSRIDSLSAYLNQDFSNWKR